MSGVTTEASAELLGFFLLDEVGGTAPLVPVGRGLTVLYGLNGAGKSRALQHVQDFWAGNRSSVSGGAVALVRLGPAGTAHHTPGDWGVGWAADWRRYCELPRAAVLDADASDAAIDAWLRSSIDFDANDSPVTGLVEEHHRDDLIRDWHAQRFILIRAVGDTGRPLWISTPAARTSPDHPAFNWAAELCERMERADDWDLDDTHALAFMPIGQLGNATVLAAGHHGASFVGESWLFATHDSLLPVGIQLADSESDVNARTLRLTRMTLNGDEIRVDGDRVGPSDRLRQLILELQLRANSYFATVLIDAPELVLRTQVVGLRGGLEWQVADLPSRLEGLSTAQRRWAQWAIHQAVHDLELSLAPETYLRFLLPQPDPGAVRFSILDEPEQALHRAAESHMSSGLTSLAEVGDFCFLIATHSPELLDTHSASLVEVTRRAGHYELQPLDAVDRVNMSRLGLTPSDLLRRQRGLLLVEGQHDADVLNILLGDELRRLRVEVLPLRGATELSAPRARFVFQYTPAHLFVLLDNVNTERVAEAWEATKVAYLEGGLDTARQVLAEGSNKLKKKLGKDTEIKYLTEFLSATLDEGTWSRVTPLGLTRGDIIEYLPVRELVPGKTSWEDLRAAYESAQQAGEKRAFKPWLTSRGAHLSDEEVRQAAFALDELPADFVRLLKTVEAHTLGEDMPPSSESHG